MLTPEEFKEEFDKLNEEKMAIVKGNPWVIPAASAFCAIPLAICIHGYWKNRQLKNKYKIEREKTKQLTIENKAGHNF
ncbi:transposase [Lactobacillus halodurans]|uniref:Transposase n=1 Tax=Companilactobacillus halodurans TaxID=2584183 RepID=A0A5P0ZRN3_9LACO|nr:transposase [Companilactobacillus halodurans]MQS76876.1 transposase [Companilactobacillus halodurans]